VARGRPPRLDSGDGASAPRGGRASAGGRVHCRRTPPHRISTMSGDFNDVAAAILSITGQRPSRIFEWPASSRAASELARRGTISSSVGASGHRRNDRCEERIRAAGRSGTPERWMWRRRELIHGVRTTRRALQASSVGNEQSPRIYRRTLCRPLGARFPTGGLLYAAPPPRARHELGCSRASSFDDLFPLSGIRKCCSCRWAVRF
jgi:hypothetical protein